MRGREDELQALTARIGNLERSDRLIKVGVGVALLGFLTAFMMGQSSRQPRIIEAEKVILYDSRGRARAVLEATGKEPSLSFMDEAGKRRVLLHGWNDGPGLALSDQNGVVKVSLGVSENQASLMFEGSHMSEATLGMSGDYPRLNLAREQPREAIELAVEEEGSRLTLHDKDHRERLRLQIAHGKPSVVVLDAAGRPRFVVPR